MTKKLILALLAQSAAMAESPCAPEMPVAAGNSWFGVGVDMGAAFLSGSVSQNATDTSDTSDTSTANAEQKSALNEGKLYLAPELKDDVTMNPWAPFLNNDAMVNIPQDNIENQDQENLTGSLKLVPSSTPILHNGKMAVDFGGVPFNMADSSKKTPSTSTGFVGQLSFHYMTKIPETMMAVGLHAGIGYNGARSSLSMPMQTVNASARYKQNIEDFQCKYENVGNAANPMNQWVQYVNGNAGAKLLNAANQRPNLNNSVAKQVENDKWVVINPADPAYVSYSSKDANLYAQDYRGAVRLNGERLGDFTQSKKDTNINAKATISSGLMLQAGTRLGAMIGNVFPHIRVGWAAYQLKAQITNQTVLENGTSKEKMYDTVYGNGAVAIGGKGLGLKGAKGEDPVVADTVPFYQGKDGPNYRTITEHGAEYLGSLRPNVGSDLSTRTVHSKYKWTNALTLGAGIDWAYQNMTFGLYYQAAICQKVNFDNWKNDVVTGTSTVTSLSNADAPKELGNGDEFNGIASVNPKGEAVVVDPKTNTEGTSKVAYTTSKPATVSMSPVFNTVMLSAKYCFKAA